MHTNLLHEIKNPFYKQTKTYNHNFKNLSGHAMEEVNKNIGLHYLQLHQICFSNFPVLDAIALVYVILALFYNKKAVL